MACLIPFCEYPHTGSLQATKMILTGLQNSWKLKQQHVCAGTGWPRRAAVGSAGLPPQGAGLSLLHRTCEFIL